MTIFEICLLTSAGFLAGVINAIAGGGSFLTFPALVFAGVPTIPANATSAVAVFPGYLSGALGYLDELRLYPRRHLSALLGLSVLGGVLGSLLLLVTPATVFSAVVPWLLGFATLVFALGKRISNWAERRSQTTGNLGTLSTLIVCIYGGYFNGGLGIILLALFSTLGVRDLNVMNGLKNAMSFILSAASVVTFALAGIIYWPQALLMMVSATVGGYCGALLARRLSARVIRSIVICVGVAMTIVFTFRTI
ncbi:sulfite exporter TauE/SafE family protein [uncultured Roseobacter sp.]|uniref:sulfite exporter TauE/SafE family protein n=1 Tax=uncultured Roseobacter sp. TaxID=114847 RepID=UPI002625FC51|nr:sulfite exporter TauE/SafE family protein [uncultured Roseobacter sp.]